MPRRCKERGGMAGIKKERELWCRVYVDKLFELVSARRYLHRAATPSPSCCASARLRSCCGLEPATHHCSCEMCRKQTGFLYNICLRGPLNRHRSFRLKSSRCDGDKRIMTDGWGVESRLACWFFFSFVVSDFLEWNPLTEMPFGEDVKPRKIGPEPPFDVSFLIQSRSSLFFTVKTESLEYMGGHPSGRVQCVGRWHTP